jgi:hypothetical protein
MQRREKMLTVNNFISLLIKMSKIKIEKKKKLTNKNLKKINQ